MVQIPLIDRYTRWGKGLFGEWIYHTHKCTNTMDIAKKENALRPLHGAVFCADWQTKGRGTYGRQWITTQSEQLLMTLVLQNDALLPPIRASQSYIGLRTVFALHRTITSHITNKESEYSKIKIKWPNDILIDNKKCAGILVEANPKVSFVGIGCNIVPETSLIPDCQFLPTSLTEHSNPNHSIDRKEFIGILLDEIETVLRRSWDEVREDIDKVLWDQETLLKLLASKQFIGTE